MIPLPSEDQPITGLPASLQLKSNLSLHNREDSQQVVLEDEDQGKFFRLGPDEAAYVAALIETGSPQDALTQRQSDGSNLTMQSALKLCTWLAACGLVEGAANVSATTAAKKSGNPLAQAFFWKVPLCNPQPWVDRVLKATGWLWSPRAMILGVCFFLFTVLYTMGRWGEFSHSYDDIFTSWRWISLAIGWCVLKLIHELAHAATCRRYGGDVKEAGLAMILLMPIAFVNVTSSWRFPSRWQRLHVTLAGVGAELFIGGVALFAWNFLDSMPLKQAAADIVLLATVSSILFNLNPLLRFDGYFAIADISGIDNLYSYGQSYARFFGARYVLGLSQNPPALPERHAWWIKCYGIAAAAYRVVTVTGLLITAAAIFHGAGIIIAIAGAFSFIFAPLTMLVKYLIEQSRSGEVAPGRLGVRLLGVAVLVFGPLWLIPAQLSWTAPAVVQYDPPAIIRPLSAGFVETIHVHDGQQIKTGQPLVTLRNDDLRLKLAVVTKNLAQIEQEILGAQWHADSSAAADARARRQGLVEQQAELRAKVDGLKICAPNSGTLIARQLPLLPGTYIKAGHEIAVIGNPDSKRLKVSITQSDAKQADQWRNEPVKVNVPGYYGWTATVQRVETRAALSPPAPSLLAINGGSLATMIGQDKGEFQLTEPRVNAYVSLTQEHSRLLHCGQRAYVQLATQRQSIGSALVGRMMKLTTAIR